MVLQTWWSYWSTVAFSAIQMDWTVYEISNDSSLKRSLKLIIGKRVYKSYRTLTIDTNRFVLLSFKPLQRSTSTWSSKNWCTSVVRARKLASTYPQGNTFRACPKDCVRIELNWSLIILSVIWSVLYSLKDSPDQQHGVGNLVELLKYGGFFRDTNGLNNLQTFKRFAQILNKPHGFTVDYFAEPISTFINNFSLSKLIYTVLNYKVHSILTNI